MSTAPTVSMVKDAYKTETRDVPADKVIAAIRNGKWRPFIEEIRQEQDKDAQYKMKVALPGVLFSGKFSERKNEALIQHSGLICADLDNLNGELQNAREKLAGSFFTWGLFASTRGGGLKVLFRVPADASQHKASWRAAEKLVKELTGVQIDEACKDPARLCFVSDDPEAYHNPGAQELAPLPELYEPKPVYVSGDLSPDMPLRERIASELLGPLSWSAEKGGYFCRCPGEPYHTSVNREKHTILYLDTAPTLDCRHNSCRKVVEAFNAQLRSQIGKAERVPFVRCDNEQKDGDKSYKSSLALVVGFPQPPGGSAFHGLAGDIARRIEPHTESDPTAVLVQTLAAFGSVIGRTPFAMVESSRHTGNLFAVLVGESSKARKGTSLNHVLRIFERADETWKKDCVVNGLSSGEGLIWSVRDAIEETKPIKNKGRHTGEYETVITDQGVEDKRLCVQEGEFANVLKVMGREGNTLSPVIRSAWDTGNLRSLTKNFPAKATDAHITIIGHITRDELRRMLTETESANGFANRFLWLAVRRSKCLPEGGNIDGENLNELVMGLHKAIDFARLTGEVKRSDAARELWARVYPELSEGKPGLMGAITARGEAQVLRLSVIYALLDCSSTVEPEHLRAALALWSYCERSAYWIFGTATGGALSDKILTALQAAGEKGLTRTEILKDVCQRNVESEALDGILQALEKSGATRSEIEPTSTKPCQRWFFSLRRYDLYDLSRSIQSNNSYKSLSPVSKNGDVGQAVSTQNGESANPIADTKTDRSGRLIEEAKHLFNAT